MSRARLLRQYLTDYNRKVEKADDIYKEQYGAYKAKAEEYNAFVNSVKAGQQQAVGEYAPGAYTMLKGYSDSNGIAGLTALSADSQGNPYMSGALVDKLPETSPDGNPWTPTGRSTGVYLKNPDGTATFHEWNSGGSGILMGSDNDAPANTGFIYDDMGNVIGSAPAPAPGWVPTTYTARIMDNSGIVAPEQQPPPEPRFTQNQIREMENPTDDAAGMAKANALGYTGNSRLKGDDPASRNSAFSNLGGDDPNNLKDKGVLARALAGEI